MTIAHTTKGSIFGRLSRGFIAAAASVGLLCASTPAHADDTTATVAFSIAGSILDETVGFGVGSTILSVFQEKQTTAVDLSEAAFAEIRDIVEDVVQTYTWMDYYNYVEDAEDAAILYTRDPNDASEVALLAYVDDAKDVVTKADEAINRMLDVGLQGTPTYILMASLQLKFLEELADIETVRGSTANADHYRAVRAARAKEHYEHLWEMWFAMEESLDDLRPITWLSSDGYCYWTAGVGYGVCNSSWDAVKKSRDSSLGGGSETVVGKNFLWFMLRLSSISGLGTAHWMDTLSGQQIASSHNTAMCIQKKNPGFDNGNPVELRTCSQYLEQDDTFIYEPETGYIRFQQDPSACLHRKNANWTSGNPIVVKDCNNGVEADKSWDFDAESGTLVARSNKTMCITKKNTNWDDGNPIQLWQCAYINPGRKKFALK